MRKYLISLVAAGAVVALTATAAQAGTGGEQPPAGVVSAAPVTGTPHLPPTSSTTMQIRQLVECGGTMYAVGTFSSIIKSGTTFTRTNMFSFKATSPYTVTSWAPKVVGSH